MVRIGQPLPSGVATQASKEVGAMATGRTFPTEGREVVGIFRDAGRFRAAVEELMDRTFSQEQVSVLAAKEVLEAHDPEELAGRPDVPREGYADRESKGAVIGGLVGGLSYAGLVGAAGVAFAIGGPVGVAALAGAATGATVGGVLSSAVGTQYSAYYEEAVQQGGIVCWVRTRTQDEQDTALAVLERHGAEHVHAHDISFPKEVLDADGAGGTTEGEVTRARGPAR
jgi:hypothetical protein